MSIGWTCNNITYSFSEFITLQNFIAFFNIVITNLSISDKDNFLYFLLYNLFCYNFRRCSTFSTFTNYLIFHLFFICFVDVWIPLVISTNLVCMDWKNICYCLPVVITTTSWATDIYHKGKFFRLRLHSKIFYY